MSSVNFPSPKEFIAYFQQHESLEIPPNLLLKVENIALSKEEEEELAYSKADSKISAQTILNFLIQPAGKTITIANSQAQIEYKADKHLEIKCPSGFKLITYTHPIFTHIKDLFRRMVLAGVTRTEFAPCQSLIIRGLPPESSILKLPKQMKTYCPKGYFFDGDFDEIRHVNGLNEKKEFQLSSIKPQWILTLEQVREFASMRTFRNHLDLHGKLTLRQHERLLIRDSYVSDLAEQHKSFKSAIHVVQFVLNQAVLSWGSKIVTKCNQPVQFKITLTNAQLELTPDHEVTIEAKKGPILTTLIDLGRRMLENDQMSLKFEPGQALFVGQLSKVDLDNLRDPAKKKTYFETLLAARAPMGHVFTVTIPDNDYGKLINFDSDPQLFYFEIFSKNPWEIKLKTTNSEINIVPSLIHYATTEQREAIFDFEPEALGFIFFKIFYYFCNEEYRRIPKLSRQLPKCFKPVTQNAINANLEPDSRYAKALRLVKEDSMLRQKLQEIITLSPADIDKLSADDLDPNLGIIIKTLKEMAYNEQQASPFLPRIDAAVKALSN